MRGDGRIFQRGAAWWIAYYVRGVEKRESAGRTEDEAKKLLKKRHKEILGGRYVGPDEEKLTVSDLLDGVAQHLENKGARGKSHKAAIDRARAHFGLLRALDLKADRIERFIAEEKAAEKPKSAATINRAVQVLKQAYRLALKDERISRVPGRFPMLKEHNARQGFFEHAEFEAVKKNLPLAYGDAAEFAYLTGWRKGEVLPLRWDAIDRAAGEVRLRISKNDHGRVIPLEGELAALLENRWQAREWKDKDGVTHVSPLVFHRKGKPLGDFRKAWAKACKEAGCPGRLFHDLWRTAVRNMVRAGVPQSVAMSISGHRTVSMFFRYNITSGADQREAFRRVEKHLAEQSRTATVTPLKVVS